jgi:hypothetical protein
MLTPAPTVTVPTDVIVPRIVALVPVSVSGDDTPTVTAEKLSDEPEPRSKIEVNNPLP